MAVLESFSPSLTFFDDVYGADMDRFPVSLDTVFYAAEGGELMFFPCRCRCSVGEGGWVQISAKAGDGWVQIPLAEDVEESFERE